MPDGPPPSTGTGTDLEVARLSSEAMWAGDAASRMLGMEVAAVGPGTASVTMTVREDMVNGWGTCHGGLLATLADTAFAVACNSRGTMTVAAGFDVSFLEPGRLGDQLVASAREVVLRGRSGIFDVSVVRSADGATIAEFRGRSRSTERRNPPLEDGSAASP